ncbi:MAG: transporter [Rhodospirillaceae bacterium]|nr:transporter [Rhodospirillaceae bacterium]
MIWELFSIVAPVFVCAGIGYSWSRLGFAYDIKLITQLVSYIGAPCLIFTTLVNVQGLTEQIGFMALASLAAITACFIIGGVILKIMRLPIRTYLAPIAFPNSGNMGLPLCLFAFGETGLALGIGFFAISATIQLVFGQWLFSGLPTPIPLLKAPIPYAVIAGAIFMTIEIEPPHFILNTTDLLGNFTIPLMMLTLGVSLARMRITKIKRTLSLAILRLLLGALVGFGIAEAFNFEGIERSVLIIQSMMPVAVFNYLFAQYYERDPEEVASLVVLSSAIGFTLLPLIVFLAK